MTVDGNVQPAELIGLAESGVGPVSRLPVTKKAAKLRILLPRIEQALVEGVAHSTVLSQLNSAGFGLTESYYKNILRRLRKEARSGVAAATAPPVVGSVAISRATQPPSGKVTHPREGEVSLVPPAGAKNKFVWDVKSPLPEW